MRATTDALGLRGLAARWPEMDAAARRAATAPARAGRQRRFVEQAQREADMGLIPPEEVERRAEELRSDHYRMLRHRQISQARRDRAELARLRSLVADRDAAAALADEAMTA